MWKTSESQERAGDEGKASWTGRCHCAPPAPPREGTPIWRDWCTALFRSVPRGPACACLCLDVNDHDALGVLEVRPRAGPPRKASPAELTWGFVQIPFLLA